MSAEDFRIAVLILVGFLVAINYLFVYAVAAESREFREKVDKRLFDLAYALADKELRSQMLSARLRGE